MKNIYFFFFVFYFNIVSQESNLDSIDTQFYLPTYDNNQFFSSEIFGAKAKNPSTTVFSFFATWCEPCIGEIKELDSISNSFPEVKFYLINYKEKKDTLKQWLNNKVKTNFTILLDTYGIVGESKFNIIQQSNKNNSTDSNNINFKLPQLFLVNKDGKVVFSSVGYNEINIKNLINKLNELNIKKKK